MDYRKIAKLALFEAASKAFYYGAYELSEVAREDVTEDQREEIIKAIDQEYDLWRDKFYNLDN